MVNCPALACAVQKNSVSCEMLASHVMPMIET